MNKCILLCGEFRSRLLLLFVFAAGFCAPSLFAAIPPTTILPADRSIDWSTSGVPGGIPTRTTIYKTFTSSATLSQIQGAIDTCPSDQVVYLGAGTYNLGGVIALRTNNITLRGAGPGQTILVNSGIVLQNDASLGDAPATNATANAGIADWTAGYAKGSTSITLSTINYLQGYGPLTVGMELVLDQTNDPSLVNNVGDEDTYNQQMRVGRNQLQMVRITAINGTTLTISPGIYASNWSAARSPKAYWWGFLYNNHSYSSLNSSGVEGLTMDNTNAASANPLIYSNSAYGCWIYNCSFIKQGQLGVQFLRTLQSTISNCLFDQAQNYGSTCYGTSLVVASACRVENNRFYKVSSPVIVSSGSSGNVIGYNYAVNQTYVDSTQSFMPQMIQFHGAHPMYNLIEGNVGNGFELDFIHGSGSHNVAFRNRFFGRERTTQTYNTNPINIQAWNRYSSIIGNVLGVSGFHSNVQWLTTLPDPSNPQYSIYRVGFQNNNAGFGSVGNDSLTVTTLIRHGNFDTVSAGITWDSGMSDHTLPSSFYQSDAPAFFGALSWPAIDPAHPSDDPIIIPAGYRYVKGIDPTSSTSTVLPAPTNTRVN